ncbi:annexin A3-like [Macrobrachium rosenbergii]|uniref:annexin A3-like n=1 Tax=Macrobrachium rosenbergii TaxID=79674 RepID=UPI0034D6C177
MHPTIVAAPNFDPDADAKALRAALEGTGTDEKMVIDILTNRTSNQRKAILRAYNVAGDLVSDIKGDLSGNFEDLVVALMTPLEDFLAKELDRALEEPGNEDVIVEIICTRDNDSLRKIRKSYEVLFGKSLLMSLKRENVDEFFEKLLIDLCHTDRAEGPADEEVAPTLVKKLYRAGEGRAGTDEDEIRRILANHSYSTLRLVFESYRKEYGRTLAEVMEEELEGDFKKAMLALYNSIQNTPAFFAQALNTAIEGLGTDDKALIRILVSRSEIDLASIKREYKIIFNKSLEEDIKGDTSGYYEKMLLAILTE